MTRRRTDKSIERDEKLIEWIDEYLEQNQFAPSLREVGKAFNLSSVSSVQRLLMRLNKQGRVDWIEGESRTLHVRR